MHLGNICSEGWCFIPVIMFIIIIFLGIVFSRRGNWFGKGRFGRRWMQDCCGDNFRTWNDESALDILKKRYAKGEINKEEFDQMKKEL